MIFFHQTHFSFVVFKLFSPFQIVSQMSHFHFASPSDYSFKEFPTCMDAKCKIKGIPRPMARPLFSGKGKPHCYSQNQELIDSFVAATKCAIRTSTERFSFDLNDNSKPTEININFYFSRPNSHFHFDNSSKQFTVPQNAPHFRTGTPDLDNLIKLVLDALEGIFYKNDSSIVCINAKKLWMEKPGSTRTTNCSKDGCIIFHIVQHKQNICPSSL